MFNDRSLPGDFAKLILDRVLHLPLSEANLLVGIIEGHDILLEERKSEGSILVVGGSEEHVADVVLGVVD